LYEELEAKYLSDKKAHKNTPAFDGAGGDTIPEPIKFPSVIDIDRPSQLDEDLMKMKLELNQSYELFQKLGDRFESINFSSLKSRIKDLNVTKQNNVSGKAAAEELKKLFEKKYMENRLDELTTEAAASFRMHPGEFGDIPEISEFFKTCNQLENGLEKINRQRKKTSNLSNRIMLASESSLDRIDVIRKELDKKK